MSDDDRDLIAETDYRYGRIRYPVNWPNMSDALGRFGDFSLGECRLIERILRVGDIAMDIGANIGVFTLAMARAVGPGGQVEAFEPQASIYRILEQNLALNGAGNVNAHMAAVSVKAGHLYIASSDLSRRSNMGNVTVHTDRTDGGQTVPAIRLDDLDLPSCRLLKIDVEGHESEVLDGGLSFLTRHRPWISVEMDRDQVSWDWFDSLKSEGYRFYFYYPLMVTAGNYKSADIGGFPRIISSNLLCVPRPFEETGIKTPVDLHRVSRVEQVIKRIEIARAPGKSG